ncbi:MAG: hypothetical protein QOC75_2724 [Pseudonocardiales bacterium]|nr:hypothetical protein [Pseudonocardiales bacterium]
MTGTPGGATGTRASATITALPAATCALRVANCRHSSVKNSAGLTMSRPQSDRLLNELRTIAPSAVPASHTT